jgi:hypothetical protein
VARWLRLQRRASLLILSFFVSSFYRTITGAWPYASHFGGIGSSANGAKRGLLIPVGLEGRSRRYALEFDSAFPYLHLQTLTSRSVPVPVSNMACLSKAPIDKGINAMQFGIGPSGSSGVCPANAPGQALFSSNPVPPSTGIGNPPDINIGEPAPGGENQSCGGCSGGGACNCGCACNCDCGCNACDCSCDNPFCDGPFCDGIGFTSSAFCY